MRFAASEPITNFLQRKENYQDLVGQAAQERAAENAAISEAEGLVARTGIQGEADIKSAKLTGAATRYAGQQAGNAAMFGGAMRGIAGLAGGAVSKYGARTPMSNNVPGVSDNPIPGQTGNSIAGARGTVVDSTYNIPSILTIPSPLSSIG